MRRMLILMAALALAESFGLAQQATQEKPAQQKAEEKEKLRYQPPEIVATAEAKYPITSVAEGTVVLLVTLDETGEMDEVKVLQGIPSLTSEAQKALKKWRFKPARLDGKPVRSQVPVAFVFTRPVLNP